MGTRLAKFALKLRQCPINGTKKLSLVILTLCCIWACDADPGNTPDFNDDGKAIKHLMTTYNCEAVEFEDWDDDDTTDSTLTIGLVNSKNIPPPGGDVHTFEVIASQVRNALKDPDRYKSYYVVFVTRTGSFIFEGNVHSYGGEVIL